MKNNFLLAGLILCTTACTNIEKTKLTGCDHPSKWCNEIRSTAKNAFVYAQIASNTYSNNKKFILPSNYNMKLSKENDAIGFAYSIYEIKETETTIISFRGTENLTDWWYGNILKRQNKSGLELFDSIKEKAKKETKFIVTGHSLGGAIALEISLKRENVDAYVFNTSPRFSHDGYNIENKRFSIVENGEILKIIRAPSKEATQQYTSISCSKGGPFSQHEQSKLASCLTQIAATESKVAASSLSNNGIENLYK